MTYATWAKGCGCMTSAQTGTANGYTCPWHRDRHMALLGGYERQVAALREENARLRGRIEKMIDDMELVAPGPIGPLWDIGWTAAIRTIKERVAALLDDPEGQP